MTRCVPFRLSLSALGLRFGAIEHWAGDPECKARSKARAHIAIAQPRHDDDGGLYVPSGTDAEPHAYMVNDLSAGSKARPAAPSSSMQMEVAIAGLRRFFPVRQST